ncbi:AAA family ATPase [Lentzea sp. NPDC058436]|uniref:helix-turn-helix transcriptional regulator n=1 Tax=Lentzea sp. NPDC058436 TaxID=3346499 RepID=UPI0036616B3A
MDGLVGRDDELAAVLEALSPRGSGVLLLLGDPGIGKSALVDVVTRRVRDRGVRVLSVVASVAESDLPFAGLHQLLRPVPDVVDALPERQREALRGAFGLGEAVVADRMLTCLAVLSVLSALADAGPVLVVVDDTHWLDSATRDVLQFLARRLEGEPVGLLMAGRSEVFDDVPSLVVPPLTPAHAERVLNDQPSVPTGPLRERILREAAGNPLALVEFARAGPADGDALPLPELLERTFADQVAVLPENTRHALVVAAAEQTATLMLLHRALGHDDLSVWAPAERAGLVWVDQGELEFRYPAVTSPIYLQVGDAHVRFRHSLVRSAVYGSATYFVRSAAHRALAAALDDDPDRQAWHLAAATLVPDERVAAALEAVAMRAVRRSAVPEAFRALERAAQLSTDPARYGERLAQAAFLSVLSGRLQHAAALAARMRSLTGEQSVGDAAVPTTALIALFELRFDEVFDLTLPVLAGHPQAQRDVLVGSASVAGSAIWETGRVDRRDAVRELTRGLVEADGASWPLIGPELPFSLWLRSVLHPHENVGELRARMREVFAHGVPGYQPKVYLGSLALVLDEHEVAARLMEEVAGPAREDAAVAHGGRASRHLALAWYHLGRWQDARLALARPVGGMSPVAVTWGQVLEATLAATSGDTARARELVDAVISVAEPAGGAQLLVQARWAAGLAALADGDHEAAYRSLRSAFDADGTPVHFHLSPYVLGDLAAVAVVVGEADDALKVLDRAAPAGGSARLRQVVARARAMLADEPEEFFALALGDDEGERWPFLRAQVRLDHGEWLRRQRRISRARAELGAAHEVFARLGARPWTERAAGELRAAGASVGPVEQDVLGVLTPQQQQIVRLAAEGLTNKEIGERLFLSHRTVGFHLYKSFPLLGVTTRAQLRDVVDPRR